MFSRPNASTNTLAICARVIGEDGLNLPFASPSKIPNFATAAIAPACAYVGFTSTKPVVVSDVSKFKAFAICTATSAREAYTEKSIAAFLLQLVVEHQMLPHV